MELEQLARLWHRFLLNVGRSEGPLIINYSGAVCLAGRRALQSPNLVYLPSPQVMFFANVAGFHFAPLPCGYTSYRRLCARRKMQLAAGANV